MNPDECAEAQQSSGNEQAESAQVELRDYVGSRPVVSTRTVYEGMVWNIGRDTVAFAPGVEFDREYVAHTGAVAVLPFTTGGRVIVIRQYRHPAASTMWEIPAGLLDHEGEDPAQAALRELTEETGYESHSIAPLTTFFPSPGGSNETIQVFVADGCEPAKNTTFKREHEEAEIEVAAVNFAELLEAARKGNIRNGTLLMAVYAYAAQSIS